MSVPADYPREGEFSTEVADLIDSVFLDSAPIAGRLLELLEERGRGGPTEFNPVRT